MAWAGWPGAAPPMPSAVSSTLIPGAINPAPSVMPAPMQYSPEQWAQAQQQNWQQWATWQQQFQQWQQRYGAEYQSAMQGMTAGSQPPLPGAVAPTLAPPLPVEKPPLPPEDPPSAVAATVAAVALAPTPVQAPTMSAYSTMPPSVAYAGYSTAPPTDQVKAAAAQSWPQKRPHAPDQATDYGKKKPAEKASYQWPAQAQPAQNQWPASGQQYSQPPPAVAKPVVEELSEAEKKFDKEFAAWEAQFNKWKDQNANHPDKTQYREYEKKWESWRNSLLERREQMRRKRIALAAASSKAQGGPPPLMSQPPPLMGVPPPAVQKYAGRDQPPPQHNNEPLGFKQPTLSAFPSQSDGGSSGFLSSSNTGGIPGLDLVKDDENKKEVPEKHEDPVIDLDKDLERPKTQPLEVAKPTEKGPDLDAISKGINNILGDQKLLSMLSMVSQNQSYGPGQNNMTNSTANIGYGKENYGTQQSHSSVARGNFSAPPPSYNDPPPGFKEKSNQSYEDDYHRQRETVNNFDDQTRSSFTMGPGDQDLSFRNRNIPPSKPAGLPESDRFLIRNSFGSAKIDNYGGPNRPFDKEEPVKLPLRQPERNFNDKFGNSDRFNDREDKFARNRSSGSFSQESKFDRGFDRKDSYNEYEDYENEDDYDRYHSMFQDDDGHYEARDEGRHDMRDEGRHDVRDEGRYDMRDEGRYDMREEGRYDMREEGRYDMRDERRYDMREEDRGFNNRAPPPVQEPPPKIQPLMALNFEPPPPVQEPEEEIFEPATVIDYEHKSKYSVDIEVTVEPFYTFDYRHKPLNRIPFPQRPKWLLESVKSIKEFDPLASISTLQKYERSFYDRQDIERGEDRYVRPRYDDRYPRDVDRGPVRRDDREGPDYNRRRPNDFRRDGAGDFRRDGPGDFRRDGPGDFRRDGPGDSRRDSPGDSRRDGPGDSRRDGSGGFRRDGSGDFRREGNRNENNRREDNRSENNRREDNRSENNRREDNRSENNRREDNRSENSRREDRNDRREGEKRNVKKNDFEELSDEDMEWERSDDKRESGMQGCGKSPNRETSQQPLGSSAPPRAVPKETHIDDILNPPGRFNRPAGIVIILRGPPGSGKTYLARLIKDKEVENGGSAPRILSLDDYFMVEQEKEVFEDGKKQKVKEMVYEYEAEMEESYRASFVKSFKKTITDGYFPFIIVDTVNDKVKYFGEMWSFAKQNGFQVYICQMDLDPVQCTKRNIHNRTEKEIEDCISGWEPTPDHHPTLDASSLLQSSGITEVEMEVEGTGANDEEGAGAEDVARSKWDNFDCSFNSLAKLDGVNKPLRKSKTMEEFLQLEDEWEPVRSTKPGQKRVRWADLEEQRKQAKMRAIGFTIGTDWNRMMDPTDGSAALTQTKYIERVNRY